MRIFVSILLVFAALGVAAFDSADWLCKREIMTREAERLRGVYSNCLCNVVSPADKVSVPVESFEDGSIKTLVSADKAQYFLQEGLIWGTGVVVRVYAKDGSVEGCLTADSCVVDRSSKCGWAEGKVTVTHGKTRFAGVGAFFSSPESYVKVFRDSKVTSDDLKFGGLRK